MLEKLTKWGSSRRCYKAGEDIKGEYAAVAAMTRACLSALVIALIESSLLLAALLSCPLSR